MRLGTLRYRQDERIERIAYSSDGRFVVTDNGKAGLQVWDAWDGRKVRSINLGLDPIRDMAFSPDGKLIATAGFVLDQKLRLLVHRLIFTDFATGRQIMSSEGGEEHAATKIAFAPDGKTIATVNDSDTLRFWDVASGNLSFETSFERERLSGIQFSPDIASHLLAVSGQTVHLWNVENRREERQLGQPDGSVVSCLAFSRDGKTLVTPVGFEGAIQVWRVADGQPLLLSTGKNASVHALSFSPDGKLLAATGQEGHLTLWNLDTGQENEPFATEGLADGPLAFSPDGRTIASTGGSSALHFWDRTSGKDRLATPECASWRRPIPPFPRRGKVADLRERR